MVQEAMSHLYRMNHIAESLFRHLHVSKPRIPVVSAVCYLKAEHTSPF